MNRDRFLELRILDGVHAGARAPLAEAPQVLGSSHGCDFVLTDEGLQAQHARIEVGSDGAVRLHGLQDGAVPVLLAPGVGVPLGPITVAVDWADTPWQAEPAGGAVAAFERPLIEDTTARLPAPLPGEVPVPTVLPATPPLSVRAGANNPRTAWVLAGAAMLVIAGGLWWTLQAEPPPASPAARQDAVPDRRDAIVSVVNTLGLAERVRVEQLAGGAATVHAGLLTDDEAEALATALSRLSPRPGLRIASENELQLAVAESVQRQTGGGTWPVTTRYLGEGRFRLEGRTATAADKDKLLAALRAEFPQARAFESALVDQGERATAMIDDLRKRGIGELRGEWNGQLLALSVSVMPSELPRWEQALLAVSARHDVPFRATVDLAPELSAAAGSTPSMPLRIRSIVSGDSAYVVLADGTKLMTDGARDGWRVVSIQPQSVIFEGPQARRVVLNR